MYFALFETLPLSFQCEILVTIPRFNVLFHNERTRDVGEPERRRVRVVKGPFPARLPASILK